MYALTSIGAAIALIPKVGLQSMRRSLRTREFSIEAVKDVPVRVMFLRNPFSRLISAYCFFRTIYDHGSAPSPSDPQPADVSSWDAFIAHVRANPSNAHWRPQIEIYREFKPTNLHRFEDIDAHWSKYHGRPIERVNESDDYPVGEIPEDIAARYTEEAELWRGL